MYYNGNDAQRHTWGATAADKRMNDGQTKQRAACNVQHPLPLEHTHSNKRLILKHRRGFTHRNRQIGWFVIQAFLTGRNNLIGWIKHEEGGA